MGIPAYEAEGAIIVTVKEHEEVVRANARTRHLADVMNQRGMDVESIVGAHSNRVVTREDLSTALSLNPVNLTETVSR